MLKIHMDPGWLQVELDAATAEVSTWSPGMRRMKPKGIAVSRSEEDGDTIFTLTTNRAVK